jgi:TM2 domain-containing membrane protein YozV|tara:strand:+ start:90 stop:434 length:345 start_codon:yes stop_codon:yes gene_type:complete
MTKSLKAVLLSALVLPGCGHFSLKKPIQGCLLAFISTICIYILFSTTMQIAQDLSVQIQNGQIPLNLANLNELVSKEFNSDKAQGANASVFILSICWIIGIIDSYRIGRTIPSP